MARQSRPIPILLTRPPEGSRRFAADLHRALPDSPIVQSPLIAPEFLAPPLPPGPFQALVFTSETGVEGCQRAYPGADLPRHAYCVGGRTAQAAADAGFLPRTATGDAEGLLALILADAPGGRLLHMAGQDLRVNLTERLNSAGIETLCLTVYRQSAHPLTDTARALLTGSAPVAVPLFSPRSAQLFCAAYRDCGGRAPLLPVALSAAVAAAFDLPAAAACAVADRPEATALLQALVDRIAAAAKG